MTQPNYTIHDVDRLIAKGRLARSRAIGSAVAAAVRPVGAAAKAAFASLARRLDHARAVRELSDMDQRMLADIGLAPSDVELAASGKILREAIERPALRPANEGFAPALRAAPRAA